MKTNRIIGLMIIFLTIIFPLACKKTYDEGPKLSLKDVNVRLTGEWEATSLLINGMDKLYIIDSLNISRYQFLFPYRNLDMRTKYMGICIAIDKQGNEIHPDTAFTECAFYNDLNNIYMYPVQTRPKTPKPMVFFPNYWNYTHLDYEYWRIWKLKYKELKLESMQYNITIEMKKVKEIDPID